MKKIEDYMENTESNNRIIQKALREIDMDSLYDLCASLEGKSDLILRNLSGRVCDEVNRFFETNKNKIPESAMKKANYKFSKILLYLENNNIKDIEKYIVEKLSFDTKENIQKSLITIYYHNVRGHLTDLNSLIKSCDDVLIKKQLELVLYGCDPIKGEYLVERLKTQKQEEDRHKAEILKEGVLSILSEESVESLFEKLNV